MRTRPRPLLAELHAHTTWSDGRLSLRELVDLHGMRGFDVLCVTDHIVRTDDPWRHTWGGVSQGVAAEQFDSYVAEIQRETERARNRYGMLVVPGAELTFNDLDPDRAAHAVAIGLRRFVSVDDGIDGAIETASAAGAAIIAAHPFSPPGGHPLPRTPPAEHPEGVRSAAAGPRLHDEPCTPPGGHPLSPPGGHPLPRTPPAEHPGTASTAGGAGGVTASRLTQRFAVDAGLRALVHRFELFNRSTLFGWVAEAGLPAVACGDVHQPAHLEGWKTLLPCDPEEAALVAYLRSPRPTYLARLDPAPALAA